MKEIEKWKLKISKNVKIVINSTFQRIRHFQKQEYRLDQNNPKCRNFGNIQNPPIKNMKKKRNKNAVDIKNFEKIVEKIQNAQK